MVGAAAVQRGQYVVLAGVDLVAAPDLTQGRRLVALDAGDSAEDRDWGHIEAGPLGMPGIQDCGHVVTLLIHGQIITRSRVTR